jgi:ketosteroid isomerase-like protein
MNRGGIAQTNRCNRAKSRRTVGRVAFRGQGDGMARPRVKWLFAALLLFPALLPAQGTGSVTPSQRRDRAITAEIEVEGVELVALERETAHAMGLNNSSFFQRVYNDDYVGTAPTGEVLDRSKLVASIQNSTVKYSSFIASDIRLRIYGPTAVVTCTWSTRGVQNGRNFSHQYRVIHVYTNNAVSGWKVVASQETMLPG